MPVAGRLPRARKPVLLFSMAGDILTLLGAALLDYGLGDPWHWPHPVQGMGWCIRHYTTRCLKSPLSAGQLRGLGVLLGVLMVLGSGLVAWGGLQVAMVWGGPYLSHGLAIVLLASCFAGRSLREAAMDVLHPLKAGDLAAARQKLALYVGRDTATLSAAEIWRAVVETVSENAIDGVLAPLFYALLGTIIGVGAVPLALAYKAVSTLDSMVGYRHLPYTHLGWFSARLEDGLTWVPCRLGVFTIALLSGRPWHVWQVCRRDAIADPSPNSGWSEGAYAAALGVQLGGPNTYQGELNVKPKLGIAERPLDAAVVCQALQLTRYSFLIWLGVGVVAIAVGGEIVK
jgi:adenosylcobinamide-phosphate synthase